MDFVANFNLNKNEIEADFEVNQPAEFDAVLEINPSGANWGNITGYLSDQTDLKNALDLKADKSEVEEDITTLDNKIDNVQSDLSGDISALTQTVEDNNTAINNRVDGVVDSFDADIEEINANISNIQTTVSDNYTDLNTKIQNEAATRANNDSLLQGGINTLNTNLTAEINARTSADSNLQTQITQNVTEINSLKTTINDYGDIVLYDAADFATAAQGEKANTAIQPNDNITLLTNNAGYITNADLPSLEDLTTTEQLNAINSGATTSKIGQIATNTSNISSLTTTVTNNYNTLDGRITSEVSTLNTTIGTETTNRQNADNALQSQIDAIVSSSDVFDIVGTYAELQAYDISTVPVNDIIKVLVDSTHNNAATYYRCTETNNVKSWTYIGAEGAYYTKSEADNKFVEQTTTINNKPLSNNINLTASDVGALPSSTVIGSGVLTIQKNGSDVDTFNANATSNKSINITVPTKTSDLTNDSNFATVSQIPTNNNQLTNGAGYITSNALNGYATENFVTSQGYITGITSSDVTNALGYTPYNSTNPAGYTTNVGTVTSVNNTQPDANGNVTISTGGTVDQTYDGTSTNAQSGVAIAGELTKYPLSTTLATVATSGSYNDLSNKPTIPSAIGNLESSCLENYELQVFNDAEIYAKLKENTKSNYDFSSIETVGTGATLSSDGVASNFSKTSYLKRNNVFQPSSSPWQINLSFKTTSLTYQRAILAINTTGINATYGFGLFVCLFQGKLRIKTNIDTTSSNVKSSTDTEVLETNKKYYVRISFDGIETTKAELSTDKVNWRTAATITRATPIYQQGGFCVFGADTKTDAVFLGDIYLDDYEMFIDGTKIFSFKGQPNSDIVGSETIPYDTLFQNSKIVDSAYRNVVQNACLTYGWTPYFTIDDTNQNFTLPVGINPLSTRELVYSTTGTNSFVRKYSDYSMEQGGHCTASTAVTFSEPFKDTNYILSVPYSAKTATGFTPTQTGDWMAVGNYILGG